MKRKLEDLTDKQVVQTTPENDLAFRTLLDKNGFKYRSGRLYTQKSDPTNLYGSDACYNVLTGGYADIDFYQQKGFEILQASDFLKPSKRELIEQMNIRLDELEAKVKELELNKPLKQSILKIRHG